MSALLATVTPSPTINQPMSRLWLPGAPGPVLEPPTDSSCLRATVTGQPAAVRRDDCQRRLNEWTDEAYVRGYPPPRCGGNTCRPCARFKALRSAQAIELVAPTHTMTLSKVGSDFEWIKGAFTKLRQNLRRRFRFLAAWNVECNDQARLGHDHHIQVAAHGHLPDEASLSEQAQAVGFGRKVEVAPVNHTEAWSEYMFTQIRDGDLEHHLEMNGSRLFLASPGFWQIDGEKVEGGMDGILAAGRALGRI